MASAIGYLGATFSVGWLDLPAGLGDAAEQALVHELAILDDLEPGVAPAHAPEPISKSALLAQHDAEWREREAEWEAEGRHRKVTRSDASLGNWPAASYEREPIVMTSHELKFSFGGHMLRTAYRHRLYELSMNGHLEPLSEGVWKRVVASFQFLPDKP